jgi:cobalt-zinc-cadmium efflux system membrane fusion protein
MNIVTKRQIIPALALLLASAALVSSTGCKSKAESQTPQTAAAADPLKVKVNAELLRAIKVGKPSWQEVTSEEKVSARVETDASQVARIGSPVDGRITKVLVYEGQHVSRGQVMAMLHSNALSDTQFAFIKAFSQARLAEQSSARARQLVQSDVIGSAELQKREADVLQTAAEVSALRAQLRGLGMSDNAIQQLETNRKLNSDYPIIASISGTVIERKVTIGQVVQPAELAFLVADLSNLWLVADVPEQHAGALYPGKTVIATIPALPNTIINGKLTFISPVVSPETRTVQSRMNLPNTKGLYKPQMLASMTFESQPEKGLTVPVTAVVREDNKDFLFARTATDEFTLRPVELGPEIANRRVVTSGVTATDEIVLDGAFHLNNKRRQDQIKGAE